MIIINIFNFKTENRNFVQLFPLIYLRIVRVEEKFFLENQNHKENNLPLCTCYVCVYVCRTNQYRGPERGREIPACVFGH